MNVPSAQAAGASKSETHSSNSGTCSPVSPGCLRCTRVDFPDLPKQVAALGHTHQADTLWQDRLAHVRGLRIELDALLLRDGDEAAVLGERLCVGIAEVDHGLELGRVEHGRGTP